MLPVPCNDDALIMWPVNRQSIGKVRNKDREVTRDACLATQVLSLLAPPVR